VSGVLALALKRMAVSRGTVPSAVPVGHPFDGGTNGTLGTVGTRGTVSTTLSDCHAVDIDAIEERAALAADSVPACYLDAWAGLQCQRPWSVAEHEWRQAIEDAGHFLDAWGADAATMRWTAGELFAVPRNGRPGGLIWHLAGERVTALGEERARLADGRTMKRSVS
jgi:hypothetical protein